MKRDEKNKQMRQKILSAALIEFSNNGYQKGSTNSICASCKISKGIIYHYFKSKDGLYLSCVNDCFESLNGYIKDNYHSDSLSVEDKLIDYFNVRMKFFKTYPYYQRIFSEAITSPVPHLNEEINECKKQFNQINAQLLKSLLDQLSIRKDICEEDVVDTLQHFQDYINIHYHKEFDENDFESREEKSLKALSIVLYGIVER